MSEDDTMNAAILSADRVIATYPPRYFDDKLEYATEHPFVRGEYCGDCDDAPCTCPDIAEEDRLYQCTLCQQSGMNENSANCHLSEKSHVERMTRARGERENYVRLVSRWDRLRFEQKLKRLKQEDAASLPDNVLAAAFRCLQAKDYVTASEFKGRAEKLLHKYENMERLSILHLAVWKAECLAQMPAVNTFFAAQEWMTIGWKGRKPKHCQSGAMHTVVSLVLPFL
jgi:hypothetical protein